MSVRRSTNLRAPCAPLLSIGLTLGLSLSKPDVAYADNDLPKPSKLPALPAEYVVEDADFARVCYHPAARERVRTFLPELPRIRGELREVLGRDVLERVEIRIAAVPAELQHLSPTEPDPVASREVHADRLGDVQGAAYNREGLIALSAGVRGTPGELDAGVRALLAEYALGEALSSSVPSWFRRGFVDEFARHRSLERTETMILLTLRGDLYSLRELELTRETPQTDAFSADFVQFLNGLPSANGDARSVMKSLVGEMSEGATFDVALERSVGMGRNDLERAHRRDVAKRFAFIPVMALVVVLWASFALLSALRRRFSRDAASSERRPLTPRARRPQPALRARLLARRGDSESDAVETLAHVPPELEVPKVQHGGGWHTLH